MKGKKRNKLVALLLVMMMVLSLIPANVFAAGEDNIASYAIADDADVIRLPITIRDANEDDLLFQGTLLNGGYNQYNTSAMRTNIPDTIVNGIPQYNLAAIKQMEQYIDTSNEIDSVTNPYLKAALQRAYNATTNGNWNPTAPTSVTSINSVTYLEDARTSYEAVKWMFNHLFDDGQYYSAANLISNPTSDAQNYYTKTYPYYESLVLKPDIYTVNRISYDCYSYKSKDAYTNFHENSTDNADDQIHNVDTSSEGVEYSNGGWYPLDDKTLGFGELTREYSNNEYHNYFTTTAGNGQFVYHAADELFFAFTGDDDVFLYINGVLVVNDGGVHGEEKSWIFLEEKISDTTYNNMTYTTGMSTSDKAKTWAEYLGLQEGQIYNFNFFQMERNRTDSNFAIYTNINVVDSSAVPQKKAYQNGQELIYGSFVPQNSEITYGFELTNNGGTNGSTVTNLTFRDDLLGVNLNNTTPVISTAGKSVNTYANLEYAIYTAGSTDTITYRKLSEDTSITVNGSAQTLNGEELLKALLTNGIAVGQTFSIRGFKYNVGAPSNSETTKTISNTVYTSALGQANNSNTPKTITGYANMRVRTWNIANKSFVIDYGKKMNISNSALFGEGDTNELKILSESHTVIDSAGSSTDSTVSTTIQFNDSISDVTLDKNAGMYGNMTMNGNSATTYSLVYQPTKFLNGIDSYIVKIPVQTTTKIGTGNNATTQTGVNIMNKNVAIIPANNVYYEDDFGVTATNTDSTVGIVYTGTWSTDTTGAGTDSTDSTDSVQSSDNKDYGWDSTYTDDNMFSDGSAHKADGSAQGANGPAKATFTFKGTGVDIYSMTNMTTGKVRGTIYKVTNDGTTTTEVAKKILTVDNYAESYSGNGYYQIPTLFFEMDEYATYKVVIQVANGSVSGGTGRSIYYLDGIRVYNPLGIGASDPVNLEPVAKDAYEEANEENTKVTTLRSVLLDSTNAMTDETGKITNSNGDLEWTESVVFIDELPVHTAGDTSNANGTTAEIGTYKDYGPKNEVYLAPGNAIAFTIRGDFAGKAMLGVKSPTGTVGVVTVPEKDDSTGRAEIETSSASDQYYEIDPAVNEGGTRTVIIVNTGDVMMSLTKLRIQQPSKATNALMEVNENTLYEAGAFNSTTTDVVNNTYDSSSTIEEGIVTIDNPTPVEEVVNESSWGEIAASVEVYLATDN